MSRRATREVHSRILARNPAGVDLDAYHRWKLARGRLYPGCLPVLLLVLLASSCARAPTPQDQADLQALASTVSHASACIPAEEVTASMQALARLGVRLTSKAQAEALWNASRPILDAGISWLTSWLLQRPPP